MTEAIVGAVFSAGFDMAILQSQRTSGITVTPKVFLVKTGRQSKDTRLRLEEKSNQRIYYTIELYFDKKKKSELPIIKGVLEPGEIKEHVLKEIIYPNGISSLKIKKHFKNSPHKGKEIIEEDFIERQSYPYKIYYKYDLSIDSSFIHDFKTIDDKVVSKMLNDIINKTVKKINKEDRSEYRKQLNKWKKEKINKNDIWKSLVFIEALKKKPFIKISNNGKESLDKVEIHIDTNNFEIYTRKEIYNFLSTIKDLVEPPSFQRPLTIMQQNAIEINRQIQGLYGNQYAEFSTPIFPDIRMPLIGADTIEYDKSKDQIIIEIEKIKSHRQVILNDDSEDDDQIFVFSKNSNQKHLVQLYSENIDETYEYLL